MACKLLVGLGNPGAQYENTRHNAGFLVLDRFLGRRPPDTFGAGPEPFRHFRQFEADLARAGTLRLAKPTTYMNLSGRAVQQIIHFFRIQPEEMLIVYDDLDLPTGHLRFRQKGSSGGHRGIASIIESLGTETFFRLKVGIGRHPDSAEKEERDDSRSRTIRHVLGRFRAEETDTLDAQLDHAVDAIGCFLSEGIGEAMTRFNQKPSD